MVGEETYEEELWDFAEIVVDAWSKLLLSPPSPLLIKLDAQELWVWAPTDYSKWRWWQESPVQPLGTGQILVCCKAQGGCRRLHRMPSRFSMAKTEGFHCVHTLESDPPLSFLMRLKVSLRAGNTSAEAERCGTPRELKLLFAGYAKIVSKSISKRGDMFVLTLVSEEKKGEEKESLVQGWIDKGAIYR